ncbi:ABC transporter ATP-binding protein [Marivirga lumbricoides]|uniref:ABC transporter ATP-binding protein n=1 Tax=Marivirga lumbricoides TaxID=1046115 RepID=A0A2T4DQN0_9BACT|nr:ABC transporter ATP-binding protein [Marivirga lumbricoides]
MVSVQSLHFKYTDSQEFRFPDFQIAKGDHLLVLGKSGIGKTTLLHLLAGILKAQSGKISINDTNIVNLPTKEVDQFRAKHIGLVLQKARFISSLTLLENFQLIAHISGIRNPRAYYYQLLEPLDMADKLNEKPSELSEGEKQRAAIAMAMINKPQLLLADEPTSSLDDENCENVVSLFKNMSNELNASLIIITHDQRLKNNFNNILSL